MTRQELSVLIKQTKQFLKDNYSRLTPHQRDEWKHKLKLLKEKSKK